MSSTRSWTISSLLAGTVLLVCGGIPLPGQVFWQSVDLDERPPRRSGHALVYDASREVYLMYGGSRGEYRKQDTWEFNGDTWTEISLGEEDSPPPLTAHAMVYDTARQRTFLFGGQTDIFDASGELQTVFNGEVYEFDGTRWQLIEVAEPRPEARAAHAMAYDSRRGLVWLFGGRGKIDTLEVELLADTWYYDGSIPAWSQVEAATGPSPRESSNMIYDAARDRLYLFGGGFFGRERTDETWEFDPATGDWSIIEATDAPSPRQNAVMVSLGDGRSLLFGGSKSRTDVDGENWIFDGEDWTKISPSRRPSSRAASALAFDVVRGEGILFGGYDFEVLRDTWRLGLLPPTPTPTPTFPPASTATPGPLSPFDLSGDGQLNAKDVFVLAGEWGRTADGSQSVPGKLEGDLTRDDRVDMTDLLLLVAAWPQRHSGD